MSVRPIFKQRGTTSAPKRVGGKKKRHLRAVNPANERKRKANPDEQSIPWKTIIATTVVTSIVSTFAVTFARFLLERARARKELQALGLGQQQQQQMLAAQGASQGTTQAMLANPGPVAVHGPPQFQLPANDGPRRIPMVTQPMGNPSAYFDPNPFAQANVQRSALPAAPHVGHGHGADDDEPPRWFREFKADQEARLDRLEQQTVGGHR